MVTKECSVLLSLLCIWSQSVVLAVHASESVPPNILLFFPDELRYDWGGVKNNPYYNNTEFPLHTPHFDWLAEGGVRFTKAYVSFLFMSLSLSLSLSLCFKTSFVCLKHILPYLLVQRITP